MMLSKLDDDRLYADPQLTDFYDLENGWAPDTEYCRALAQDARRVLDLGCGTGLLAAALADGRDVMGVDPARAMLDVARARQGGDRVTWVEADARSFRSDRRFDLIVMTGHAFQCLLTDDDQRALLATIAHHLAPQGRFIFDSRNPALEEWREWGPAESLRDIMHPRFGATEAWNDVEQDPATGIVTYQTFYRIKSSGQILSAASRIRFAPQDVIARHIEEAGLVVDQWLGDWQGGAGHEQAKEIIPIGRRL
jgi:SAM-dependent methyltransferase